MGRERELAGLEAALDRAAAAQPAVALVGGESGVGKSRLTAELGARARERGTRVLAGDCVDLGEAELPYAPIVGALRELERDEVEIVGPAAAGLAPLLPQLGDGEAGHEARSPRAGCSSCCWRDRRPGRRRRAGAAGDRGPPLGRPLDA